MTERPAEPDREASASAGGAVAVGAGILTSRLAGLVREGAIAHWLGSTAFADVFVVALRGPNLIQNLLGEQALSAAFIPVYRRLVRRGAEGEARRFAGSTLGFLLVAVAVAALTGMVLAPWLAMLSAPGYLADRGSEVDRYALLVRAMRIFFPMAAVLTLSAWCLAVLNSHRRFVLSYAAPAVWSLSIVAAAAIGHRLGLGLSGVLFSACLGGLVGSLLQFLVQLPTVLEELNGRLPVAPRRDAPGMREALTAFGPALMGRGVVQVSFWLETLLTSFLAPGAPAHLARAQRLYALPVSLFGGAIAAAELPGLSDHEASDEEGRRRRAERLSGALTIALFLAAGAWVGLVVLGGSLIDAVLRRGLFGVADRYTVWVVVVFYAFGVVPSSCARLLQNAYFVDGNTATPARVAAVRVGLMVLLAVPAMLWLDGLTIGQTIEGLWAALPAAVADRVFLAADLGAVRFAELRLGAAGVALAASVSGWLEMIVLFSRLGAQWMRPWKELVRIPVFLLVATIAVAPAAWLGSIAALPAIPRMLLQFATFGVCYFLLGYVLHLPAARALVQGARSRLPGRLGAHS